MTGKKVAAESAVELIKDGMTVGLGSGSTAYYAIQKIGERVKHGLKIKTIATSVKTETLAKDLMIPVVDPSTVDSIDVAIDGADEVDSNGNLIKGGGGSLLREKIVAFASDSFYVMVDESKLVKQLGKRAVPVEIVPFAANLTLKHIKYLGGEPVLRKSKGQLFISDNGNVIADCHFQEITDPAWLDVKLKMIPGVIETGLFLQRVITGIFIGHETGETRVISVNSTP